MRIPSLWPIIQENFRTVLRNKTLILLFLSTAGFSWSTELILHISPLYIRSLGATIFETGLVFSLAGIVATALSIPGGILSDKFGRKILILISMILAIISPYTFTLIDTWTLMIPLMIIFRLTFSFNLPARMAIITDHTTGVNRSGVMSIMNLVFPIGVALGLSIGGYFADSLGWTVTFYIVAAVSAVSTIPAIFLKESREKTSPKSSSNGIGKNNMRTLVILFLVMMISSTAVGEVETLLPLYLTERFDASKTEIGLFFALAYLPFFTTVYTGAFADKVGRKKMLTLALSLMSPLFLMCGIVGNLGQLTILYMTLYLFGSMNYPVLHGLLMEHTLENIRGLATGILMTAMRIGFTIGPLIGAYLWEAFNPTAPFYFSTLLLSATIPLVLIIRK